MHIKSILIYSIQSVHGIRLYKHKLYFPTLYYRNCEQMPRLSASSWTSHCCMFRSTTLPLQIRINSTEDWNFDQQKDKLQDTTFWILKKVLLRQMETNLNFVLLAHFYIPKCTKLKCSLILARNKIVALKSSLVKTLQLMYAYTYWNTYIHTADKPEHSPNPAIFWSCEGQLIGCSLYPGVATLHILCHQKTCCSITTQQRPFMETSFWHLFMLSCAGPHHFKAAVKYSSCFLPLGLM